jgi:ribose/xylose/arabinose/galactoside ABC-type transport system permease subunit
MRIRWGRELILLIGIVLLVILLTATTSFLVTRDEEGRLVLNPQSVGLLLETNAYLVIAAIGMTIVIVSGQIDLSVGSALAVCSLAAGYSALAGIPLPLVILITIACGTAIGMVNGLLVYKGGIHSIIVTLGMMTLLRGLILVVTEQEWLYMPDSFTHLGMTRYFGLTLPVWEALVVTAVAAFLVANTRLGRMFYAVGGNDAAASISGINVGRVKLLALTLNGMIIGIASLAQAPRFTAIQNNIGKGLELLAITSAVVGGTNIFGGSGNPLGSALGVLFVGLTHSAMVFLRIPADWEEAVYGLFLLVAVGIDIVRTRRRKQLLGETA